MIRLGFKETLSLGGKNFPLNIKGQIHVDRRNFKWAYAAATLRGKCCIHKALASKVTAAYRKCSGVSAPKSNEEQGGVFYVN